MRPRTPLLTLAAFALAAFAAAAHAQEPQNDQRVIDDFVTTRGMSFDGPGKQTQKQPKPAPRRNNPAKGRKPGAVPASGGAASGKAPAVKGGAAGKSGEAGGAAEAGAQVEGAAVGAGKTAQAAPRPLALGFTMFMKDDENRLSFVEPSQEFKTDDRIAIAFETNADGYLYMFNASGDAKTPEMVFPNATLDGGANALQAHTYVTFPSDVEAGFVFTDPPATEHLFVVFSRKPLAGVPTGEALVRFCRGKGEECAWPLSAALWSRILDGAKGRRVTEAKNMQLAQSAPPPDAPAVMQRGLKVKKNAPSPAFVRVNDSPAADILVTEIVLTHK